MSTIAIAITGSLLLLASVAVYARARRPDRSRRAREEALRRYATDVSADRPGDDDSGRQ